MTIHYLHGPDLTAREREGLVEMVAANAGSLKFWEIPDEWCSGLPTEGFTRTATWYRLFLPELLPDVERVLYLDADLIVLEPVAPLWDIDFGDNLLAAVSNVLEPRYADRPRELGIPDSQGYFNAGVLLFNLDLMRRERSSQELQEYAREHAGQLLWRDQDALNVVLGPRRVPLHPRWNCMNIMAELGWGEDVFGAEALAQARSDPAIRHFEGPGLNKPWHYLAPRESRELYRRHRRATPWPRVRLEGRGPRNVWRRLRARAGGGRAIVDTPSLSDR